MGFNEGGIRIMFTKEKLEKWIEALEEYIGIDKRSLKKYEEKKHIYDGILERKINAEDLLHTLEQLHTSITSDGSI